MLKSPTMMRSLSSEVFSFRFRSIHSARDCSSVRRPAGVPHCACAASSTKSKLPALNEAMNGSRHQLNFGRYRFPTFSRGGFAATANPPREKVGNLYLPKFNWWREPFMASFSAGSFDFVLLAAHAQWGTPAGRLTELQSLAEWIDLKRKEKTSEDKDLIIVGDFNIETPEELAALTGKGLQMPAALEGKSFGTNLAQNKRYDQILRYPGYPQNFSNQAGVVRFHSGGLNDLFPGMEKTAFTFQMSDHLPLWMQINTDIEGMKLDEIIRAGK